MHGWHQVAHAVTLCGATPACSPTSTTGRAACRPNASAEKIGPATKALLVGNTNGHPAPWRELQALADVHGLPIIEDSTEAIGSRYLGRMTGSFGRLAVFDFSQPSALCCGEGGMVVTDDPMRSPLNWATCASTASKTGCRCRWAAVCRCRPA